MAEETIVVILEEKPRGNTGAVWDNLNAALAEKDAEIHRLSNALTSETRVCEDFLEACEEHEKEIARLNAVIEARTKRNNELITEIAIRISQLGGFQERIDSLEKALREAQDHEIPRIRHLASVFIRYARPQASPDEIVRLLDGKEDGAPTQKKEPELFICPAHGVSEMCPTCHHSKPHEHTGETCSFDGVRCKKCTPYKEPAQTLFGKDEFNILEPSEDTGVEEETLDVTITEGIFGITQTNLDGNDKGWRLSGNEGDSFPVTILDKRFLNDINNGKYSFTHGTAVRVKYKDTTKKKIKVSHDYEILEVISLYSPDSKIPKIIRKERKLIVD